MGEDVKEAIARAHWLKSAVEGQLTAKSADRGTAACPAFAQDGDWYRELGGAWSFGCDNCGLRATGRVPRASAN
jgi:hypothetical protein